MSSGSTIQKQLLLVDDDPDVRAGLEALLTASGWDVIMASSGREALQQFARTSPDVILLDVMLPDRSGLEVLDQIKSVSESTPVVMMSGVGTIAAAVDAMRLGAETFLSKPCDAGALEIVLEQAERMAAVRREVAAWKRSATSAESRFPGISEAALSLSEMVERVAVSTSPILLEGESGTGKGFLARAIHQRSPRSSRPFVDLNCAGLSRELLESELFGHERGSFTGASSSKPGLFEIGAGGTVFLDEIAEMEAGIQARLLKVLEDKRFRRVGGVRDIESDFRLIAATNRDLGEQVRQGRFRHDLFYRLNVVRLRVPPLRERGEDLLLLVEQFLDHLARELKVPRKNISERAKERLSGYSWPGNVRELRNVLERAMLIARGPEIRIEDILLDDHPELGRETELEATPLNEAAIRPLEEITANYIRSAVEATGGNVRAAARRLGISPSTLYARLRK